MVVVRANLKQAAAFAFLSIPVVTIAHASLRSTIPLASLEVEDGVWMLFPMAFFEMRHALALAILEVEVVVSSASGCGCAASAAACVPVEERVFCLAFSFPAFPFTFADTFACGVVENPAL